jgi:uncharacterized RmlC-like cupin family protein
MSGTDALHVELIALEASAKSPTYIAADVERFVYVIRGKGQTHVGKQIFPLDAESILWLEKGDTFHFEAGVDGLQVLLCHAPAGE